MCKVAAVAGIHPDKIGQTRLFMEFLGVAMSKFNCHGLGYAAFDSNGQLFGERWFNNNDAFRDVTDIPNSKTKIKDNNSFGVVKRDNIKSMILHTRMATCARSMDNLHPFVNDKSNPSIISNHPDLLKKYSTCDSEVIVHQYDKYNVRKNIKNIQDAADKLFGWYTCCTLAKDENDRPILDIFTDSGYRLNSGFVKELGCTIFSTDIKDIKRICKLFKYKLTDKTKYNKGDILRLDSSTGEILNKTKFDPDTSYEIDFTEYREYDPFSSFLYRNGTKV